MRRQAILIAALLPLLLTACGEPEDTRPGQPVAQRRAAFTKILKSFEPMGIQLKKNRYDADQFLLHAKTLSELKEGPWQHFGPDTNYPPTHATGKVWSDPEQFEAARQRFFKAADELVLAAGTRKEAAVRTAYETLHESCRNCHKTFKD
ncbi:MAG: cytochrome c [Azonexus sp.]|nr:cytochrome c [Azonexus sp.]